MSVYLNDHRPQPLTVRRVLAALVASGLVLICAGQADHQGATSSPDPLANVQACQEDEPCWDCSTMGNRICGPLP